MSPSRNKVHGESRTRLHRTWAKMIDRCYRPSEPNYERYGGAGVKVCDEFLPDGKPKGQGYLNFKAHLQEVHSNLEELVALKYEVDRIKGSKGYEIGNIHMVPRNVNQRNKENNIFIKLPDGTEVTLIDYYESLPEGLKIVPYREARSRLTGHRYKGAKWSVSSAIQTPHRSKRLQIEDGIELLTLPKKVKPLKYYNFRGENLLISSIAKLVGVNRTYIKALIDKGIDLDTHVFQGKSHTFLMKYGKSRQEIADILGINKDTLSRKLTKGFDIVAALKEKGYEVPNG